jgi:hypothetical protein
MKEYDPSTAAAVFTGSGWQRSAFCGPNGGNCVEVNLRSEGLVGLRDGKLAEGPVLVFDDDEWEAFLAGARAGQFDRYRPGRRTERPSEDYSAISSETSVQRTPASDAEGAARSLSSPQWFTLIDATNPASESGRLGAQYGDVAA